MSVIYAKLFDTGSKSAKLDDSSDSIPEAQVLFCSVSQLRFSKQTMWVVQDTTKIYFVMSLKNTKYSSLDAGNTIFQACEICFDFFGLMVKYNIFGGGVYRTFKFVWTK